MSDPLRLDACRRGLDSAICRGQLHQVKQHLEDLDSVASEIARRDARDLTNFALGTSCMHGQVECVRAALEHQAQVDVKSEHLKFLPLFYAARLPKGKAKEAADIVSQLVRAGADLEARDQDHNGSNALMWAKTTQAAQSLLDHADQAAKQNGMQASDYINGRDNDRKTALMWSIISRSHVSVSSFLKDQGSNMSFTDDEGSTPLHWAARANNCAFAEVLLQAGYKVNIPNLGGRTPLHLAVGKNNNEVTNLLLAQDVEDMKSGADSTLDTKSAGGWLPLHVVCGAPNVQPTIAWQLICRSETRHLLQTTSTGKTPVIIAADRGNIAVVEQLQIRIEQIQNKLEKERIELLRKIASGEKGTVDQQLTTNRELHAKLLAARGMRDNEGNIALFNDGVCESSIAREFLAPWNLNDAVRDISANIPAKQFQAKVVDLLVEPRKIDVARASVFDLIYTNPEASHSATKRTLPRKACTWRWIHLPANKRSWCRDLFQKYYIELWHAGRIGRDEQANPSAHDGAGEPGSSNGSNSVHPTENQHNDDREKNSWNETYTIEHFRKISRTLVMQRIGHTTHSAYMTPRCRHILPVQDQKSGSRRFSEPTFLEEEHSDDDSSVDGLSPIEPRRRKASRATANPDDGTRRTTISCPSLFLYMPYLHFEYFGDLCRMKASLDPDCSHLLKSHGIRGPVPEGPYSKLLFTGLHGEARDYHQRRTLDQFFYRNIKTDERDEDQVAFRYQRRPGVSGQKTERSECKIIMVDELWMWIVNDKFIVTSFPERWSQASKAEYDIWENVLDKITAKGPESVPSVYHLAAIISDTCSKAFDLSDVGKPRFLDMFEGSLGYAMEGAMSASRKLNQASVQGSKWLRSVSEQDEDGHGRTKAAEVSDTVPLLNDPKDTLLLPSAASIDENDEDSMEFVDSLLDLRNETDLVYEISDTRDEIGILSMVLTWQERILQELREALPNGDLGAISTTRKPARKPIQYINSSLRTVTTTMSDLRRMDKQAKRIYGTVTTILDIKQKYANAIEARSVRAGGLTIMVFTVATVFFLPPSFIISFFGLDLESLPHKGDDVSLSPRLVFGWVLGLGIGVALVYLAVAFQLRTINRMRRSVVKAWRGINKPNRNLRSERNTTPAAMSTSRASTGLSLAGSQRQKKSSMNEKLGV